MKWPWGHHKVERGRKKAPLEQAIKLVEDAVFVNRKQVGETRAQLGRFRAEVHSTLEGHQK